MFFFRRHEPSPARRSGPEAALSWARRMTRIMGAGLLLGLLAGALALPGGVRAEDDTEVLAEAIAASLKDNLKDPRYRTVAVSRIRPAGTKANINDLIDLINVKIVRSRHLKVIDRSRLQLILKEQKVQLSDVVSTKKYQELGKLMGVDLFIYGTFYKDTLILKGIDVQNSSLAWGEVFVITPSLQNEYLSSLAKKVVTSLGSDQERLNKSRIRLVSFWDVYAGPFTAFAVMDYIAVALTRDARFRVVDRENMQLVTKEQQLNQEVYIDESTAKKLGELYGVDGFIYGNISSRGNGSYRASLKLLSIYSGVIEWADLITLKAVQQAEPAPVRKSPPTPAGMVYVFPGGFTMGRSNDEIINGPEHKLSLPGFFIDEYEISNQDYARFIKSTRYRAPVGWFKSKPPAGKNNHPVTGINWDDAREYCMFLGKRLPSEAEWEKSARGEQGQHYPWKSDNFYSGYTTTRESGQKSPVPVNRYIKDESPYGVKNMAGNVREWVEDLLKPYPGNTARDKRFNRERVVRGGSWATDQQAARAYYRGSSDPHRAWQDVGFRCAKSE